MSNVAVLRFRVTIRVCLGLVVGLAMTGCGGTDPSKPKLGKVAGKVIQKGQPVTSGTVTFTPAVGTGGATGQIATSAISPSGAYVLTTFDTGDGAIIGQHVITVQVGEIDGKALGTPKTNGTFEYKIPKSTASPKYASVAKSPLRYTVTEGNNTYDIDLVD